MMKPDRPAQGTGEELSPADLPAAIEAILVVAVAPVTAGALAEATGFGKDVVTDALNQLRAEYDGSDGIAARGFELREIDGKWRLYSRAKWAPWVGQFVMGDHMATLSNAALETLAVVAYRQPVTRSQVGAIRGVGVDGVVRTLLARGLLEEVGETLAGAALLRTTDLFLEKMGFTSLEDLPPLGPHVAGPDDAARLAEEMNLETTE